ncbi:hypothetical protein DL89DRAFT_319986 [Linderina pennispora]|uniref:Dipeptidyl-peptidase V n=1 Tax=Linderina pennispora TaxID=61395 RepID=A0A1Y1WME4_9FUNG|nr:uncharacterized protein DL89DRAFT_319986 [Linderina pennispora]ORX74458.1 hypothetical protein DL89DRAFT_319986 [Linderina pennispora]
MILRFALRSLPASVLFMAALGARIFTPEDLVQTNRFSGSVAVAPDSHAIAYVQTHYSIDTKQQTTELFVQTLGSRTPVKLLTSSADSRLSPKQRIDAPKSLQPSQPVWLGTNTLGFVSANEQTGGSTLYAVDQQGAQWTKPRPVAEFPVAIGDVQYHLAADVLAFTAEVHNATQSLEESARLDELEGERADSGKAYEDLWIRHWDTFVTPRLPQIHTLSLNTATNATRSASSRDGRLEASNSFVFAPDGKKVAFVAKKPGVDYAYRTTSFVYLADVDGSKAEPINEGATGASDSPAFSADGSKIAFLQMTDPKYESDRNQIKIYDTADKSIHDVARDWDRSPSQILWADDKTLLAVYNDWGHNRLAKIDIASGAVTPVVSSHSVGSVQALPGTDRLLIDYSALDSPTDLYTVKVESNELDRVTELNPQFRETIYLSKPQELKLTGVDNSTIHGYLLQPPNFDPAKKYPLAFLIHGGPQSSFTDSWSSRWNPNIFAAAGFVTVALDPQGSTGYGQEFTDAIRNQWGGKPFQSLISSLDQLLEQYEYIDRDRLAALGASYGGYMINWINGHTDRFRALVNHDGMFSTISSYYSTDELYFPETEFEGVPFDDKARENYEQWSPERFVKNWKTPTLVIHSEKDYRLVVSEGISAFTALRRQNVPARFLYFPDENHWILKPANSLRWHQEVLDWITTWTNDEASTPQKPKFKVQSEN